MGSCATKPNKQNFRNKTALNSHRPSFLQQVLSVNGVKNEIQPSIEPKQIISILHKTAKQIEKNVIVFNPEEAERNVQLTVVTKSSILQRRSSIKAETMVQFNSSPISNKSPSGNEQRHARFSQIDPFQMAYSQGEGIGTRFAFQQNESTANTLHATLPSILKNLPTLNLQKQQQQNQMTISRKSAKSLEGID